MDSQRTALYLLILLLSLPGLCFGEATSLSNSQLGDVVTSKGTLAQSDATDKEGEETLYKELYKTAPASSVQLQERVTAPEAMVTMPKSTYLNTGNSGLDMNALYQSVTAPKGQNP